jgi:adenylylsulfate kinase-like enzyme
VETYLSADLAACERRDPKGLYAKARNGQITDFTGISAPYEPPTAPALSLDTASRGIDECAADTVAAILSRLRND